MRRNKDKLHRDHFRYFSSSSNKPFYKTSILATILEDSTPDTVADSAATGHFFPNENNSKNHHNQIEVVCANNQTMKS
jgi:hypothetical protein